MLTIKSTFRRKKQIKGGQRLLDLWKQMMHVFFFHHSLVFLKFHSAVPPAALVCDSCSVLGKVATKLVLTALLKRWCWHIPSDSWYCWQGPQRWAVQTVDRGFYGSELELERPEEPGLNNNLNNAPCGCESWEQTTGVFFVSFFVVARFHSRFPFGQSLNQSALAGNSRRG